MADPTHEAAMQPRILSLNVTIDFLLIISNADKRGLYGLTRIKRYRSQSAQRNRMQVTHALGI